MTGCYDPLIAGSIDGTDTVPHDKAIVRALNSCYTPPNCLSSSRYVYRDYCLPYTIYLIQHYSIRLCLDIQNSKFI